MADKRQDISRFFTNDGKMMPPLVRRVNVDFTGAMVEELDPEAAGLSISRQAVIKTLVRRALDQQYVAAASRPVAKERERAVCGRCRKICGASPTSQDRDMGHPANAPVYSVDGQIQSSFQIEGAQVSWERWKMPQRKKHR